MRIRTQFVISMALFGLTLSIIAASAAVTSRQVDRLDEQEDLAEEIGNGASELSYLAGDFVVFREDQQRARWEAKWTVVSNAVARIAPVSAEEGALATTLSSDLARLRDVFEDVVRTTRSSPETLTPVSWSRMAIQNQGVAFDAFRLSRVIRDQRADIQRRQGVLIVALLGIFGAYFATMYLIVYRRALSSLAELQAGTEVIGRGDLGHVTPVVRNDEIGDLARAFNQMASNLMGVTASKSRLEEEVAEREAAQEALQDAIAETEELSEARQQELAVTKNLLEAADVIARWTDIGELSAGLARIILKLSPHSRATVARWDDKRRELEVLASDGDAPFPVGSHWPIEDLSSAALHALGEGDSGVWDVEALPEEERGKAASDHALAYGLYMPLVQRDRTVGIILLDNPGTRREFGEREIELIRAIAAQAAVAFENAQLFEAQRHIADLLQEALLVLPDRLPGIEFDHAYHSASEAARVGGDFYDLFELDQAHVGVVIGDVAGKGLEAAVLTSMVKNTIRAHANEEGKTPSEILKLTNGVIHRATPPEAFVTVLLGILNSGDGRFVYSSAGHTTAALVCADGTVGKLPATGPLLGAFSTVGFEQAEARLDIGDVLFLYTDGLTEARREGEIYGEDRLFGFLESMGQGLPQELVPAVFADAMSFSGGQLRDDIAILSVRRVEDCTDTPA